MRIDIMKNKKQKKYVTNYIQKKLPLFSRVEQFNSKYDEIYIEYIEQKILTYEILIRKEENKLFRKNLESEIISILVNTQDLKSQSIDENIETLKVFVPKESIRKNNIDEEKLIEIVKKELVKFFKENKKYKNIKENNIANIKIIEIKSIYKPIWIFKYKNRSVILDL